MCHQCPNTFALSQAELWSVGGIDGVLFILSSLGKEELDCFPFWLLWTVLLWTLYLCHWVMFSKRNLEELHRTYFGKVGKVSIQLSCLWPRLSKEDRKIVMGGRGRSWQKDLETNVGFWRGWARKKLNLSSLFKATASYRRCGRQEASPLVKVRVGNQQTTFRTTMLCRKGSTFCKSQSQEKTSGLGIKLLSNSCQYFTSLWLHFLVRNDIFIIYIVYCL